MPEAIPRTLAVLVRFSHVVRTNRAQAEAIEELAKILGIDTREPVRFIDSQPQEQEATNV